MKKLGADLLFRISISLIFIIIPATSWALAKFQLPTDERVPGGVAVIKIPREYSHYNPPQVFYNEKRVMVVKPNRKEKKLVCHCGYSLKRTIG